jgi:6-phosphogluconolactonase
MKNSRIISKILVSICILVVAGGTSAQDKPKKKPMMMVYIGTYTGGESEGIYTFRMNQKTGKLSKRSLAAKTVNPSFLAISPDKTHLYAANETGEWKGTTGTGGVTAFAIANSNGSLKELGNQPSKGGAPCHLVVDSSGKNVLVANYSGGNASVFPILDGGNIGPATGFIQHAGSGSNEGRQEAPHAHSINLDPSETFAVVADLGIDKLMTYRFDAKAGTISPNDTPSASVAAGSGPRHFAFHPNSKFAYVINELAMTVDAFQYDGSKGVLVGLQTISTIGSEETKRGYSTAHVEVHPSGKFLYGSNRGHDSIVVYKIDTSSGKLTYVENEPTQGKTPRNFGVSPDGKFLLAANQQSNDIVVFCIDQGSGALEATGHKADCPAPVCVKFLPLP